MEADPKPDKEKKEKPPEDFQRQDVEFFDEYPIYINMDDVEYAESFTVFMRPLMIKEVQILNRVTFLQEKNIECGQAAMILVNLAVHTLNVSAEEVPVEATSGLVAKMIEYNFPPDDKTTKEEQAKKQTPTGKDGLIDCFDFLISNGHNYSEIMAYPVPVFNNFIVVTAERLGIKQKPLDPAAAFKKLGLPVKPRGNKK